MTYAEQVIEPPIPEREIVAQAGTAGAPLNVVKVDPYVVSSKDPRKRRLFLHNHARELRHFSFFLHVSILSTLRGSTTASGRNQGWASFVSSGR